MAILPLSLTIPGQTELAALARGGAVLKHCLSCSPITTHWDSQPITTFHFSEGGLSSNPELIELFVSGWGERYCNNVNYVKYNAFFEPPSMRACTSTPTKQNQDFKIKTKQYNRTPLNGHFSSLLISVTFIQVWNFWTINVEIIFLSNSSYWAIIAGTDETVFSTTQAVYNTCYGSTLTELVGLLGSPSSNTAFCY